MRFEFATAARLVFGAGSSRDLGPIAREFGRHALIVTGRSPDRVAHLVSGVRAAGLGVTSLSVAREPDVKVAIDGREIARTAGCDVVIGIGGGSVIDAAKAIAALATNESDVFDYLETVGRGQPLTRPTLPLIAVPTTAGTGSEVTRNSVLGVTDQQVKVSLRHPFMLARVAVVDPVLTADLPPLLTATTGLDALTQLIEPYLSIRANPMTDALCREGIVLAAEALPAALKDGTNATARLSMALASTWSGIALANAGLGAVHGLAGPIGGRFDAPHGAICAALLPAVMRVNLRAIDKRLPDTESRRRFEQAARLMTGRPDAQAEDGIEWVRALVARAEIPPLVSYGIRSADLPDLVAQSMRASSMKANPITLSAEELTEILDSALDSAGGEA